MVKFIVEGRRWFDKTYGNTYHTVTITSTKNNKCFFISPITYGYDNQYRQTALDALIRLKVFKKADKSNHKLIYKQIYFNVSDVARKKDL